MKKIVFLAFMATMALTMSAQQELFGGAKGSPQVHGDNTVSFALKAPQAQLVELQLDFDKPVAMERDTAGIWP